MTIIQYINKYPAAILKGLVSLFIVTILLSVNPTYLWALEKGEQGNYNYKLGQEIEPALLEGAISASADQILTLDDEYNLFFSNVPEMPVEPGVLCRVDNVLSSSGKVRVLFSHLNLLIDWKKKPIENIPATVGFAVENHSNRELDLYAKRSSMAVNLTPEGVYNFKEDAAPMKPGSDETLYFGTAVGNYMVQQWYLSELRQPVFLGTIEPNGKIIISRDVGARGWITGMYDLEFVDPITGEALNRDDLNPGESVGIRTFITKVGENLESFLDSRSKKNEVLQPKTNLHMRGLFKAGIYHDNLKGEAVTKKYSINFDAYEGSIQKFALAAGRNGKDKDVYLNDFMCNGIDPYGMGAKGENVGNYGADYSIELKINGPAALVAQGALDNNSPEKGTFIDLYNQIITYRLDGSVKTVFFKDPNYNQYYGKPSDLRPHGYGKVIGVYPIEGEHVHNLNFTLPPNSYGPVRFYLMPLLKE